MCDWGGRHSLMVGQKKISRTGHFIGEDAMAARNRDKQDDATA